MTDGVVDGTGSGERSELPPFAERVLELTERVPPGKVMTYGDVAEFLEQGGPRQVGRVMALYGGGVPWWRVVRADGSLLPGHEARALARYREEGTPLRYPGGRRPAPEREGADWEDAEREGAEGAAPGGPEPVRSLPRVDMAAARWDGR